MSEILTRQHPFIYKHDDQDLRSSNMGDSINSISQQVLVVDEIIAALKGVSGGIFVSAPKSPDGIWTIIKGRCDRTVHELGERCLDIVNACQIVSRYIDENCHVRAGQMSNAAASFMAREYSKFLQKISTLEVRQKSENGLSLAQLSFELVNHSTSVRELSTIAATINNLRGCALIIALENLQKRSIGEALSVIEDLLSVTRVPLFRMIASWVLMGDLHDPFGDFFVKTSFDFVSSQRSSALYQTFSLNTDTRKKDSQLVLNTKQQEKVFLDGMDANRRPRVRAIRRTRALNKEGKIQNTPTPTNNAISNKETASMPQQIAAGEALARFSSRGVWVDETSVPPSLKSMSQRIMESGKYLAILELVRPFLEEALERMSTEESEEDLKRFVRQLLSKGNRCINAHIDETPFIPRSPHGGIEFDELAFRQVIETAHKEASVAVLKVYIGAFELRGVIESAVHCFFMRWADFFDQFLISAADELKLRPDNASLPRLQKLFAAELRNSTISRDKFVSLFSLTTFRITYIETCNLLTPHVNVSPSNTNKEPSSVSEVIEKIFLHAANNASQDATRQPSNAAGMISLHMDTPAPLRVLFTPAVLIKYQTIFRHIAACKLTDSVLARAWTVLQRLRVTPIRGSSTAGAFALRARMANFVRCYLNYLSTSVIERQWTELSSVLEEGVTLDEIISKHEKGLDKILVCSLLTVGTSTLRDMSRALTTSCLFAENVLRFYSNCVPKEDEVAAAINGAYPPIVQSQIEAAALKVEENGSGTERIGALVQAVSQRRYAKVSYEAQCLNDGMADEKFQSMVRIFTAKFDEHLNAFIKLLRGHARGGLGDDGAAESFLLQLATISSIV